MCAALAVTSAAAGSAGTDHNAKELGTWAIASQETVKKQTEEQDAYNKEHGRPTPAPELLQPSAGPSLASYKPIGRNKLRGTYDCGASDVLAGTVEGLGGRVHSHVPKVRINVDPEYAGSLGLALIDGKLDCVFVSREL